MRPPVALIAGPTASGKSVLAVALAKTQPAATVINADASQVYADIPILSARPTIGEMADIPHRLFGHIDGAVSYNAARWATEAREEIATALHRERLPILVGGSGFYLRALLDGIAPVPAISPAIRARVRAMPIAEAYAALGFHDPQAASRLHCSDRSRIARALEVILSTGKPLGAWQKQRTRGITDSVCLIPAVILPPREWLAERCNQRLKAMFDSGARQEVERLLARNLALDAPVMQAIGVAQISEWISARCSRAQAMEMISLATRQYAKRQYTWFRNQPPNDWPVYDMELNNSNLGKIVTKLQKTLLTR